MNSSQPINKYHVKPILLHHNCYVRTTDRYEIKRMRSTCVINFVYLVDTLVNMQTRVKAEIIVLIASQDKRFLKIRINRCSDMKEMAGRKGCLKVLFPRSSSLCCLVFFQYILQSTLWTKVFTISLISKNAIN